MTALPLMMAQEQKALHIMQPIAYAKHIPPTWLHKLNSNDNQQIRQNQNNNSHTRWIPFTNSGP
jgi:hypothetical protein